MRVVRERIAAACARSGRSPSEVTLIAVTKGVAAEAIRKAIDSGITDIGENRVQETADKRPSVADVDVTWHMIGHLQTNKVKAALSLFDIIHSVDSLRLAEAISSRALSNVPVFVEVNVSQEPTKTGFALEQLPDAVRAMRALPNLDVRGLMTVAPLFERSEDARPIFRRLREAAHEAGLGQLSMGMTSDYETAVEEGATHVRIGQAIFGERPA